MKKSIGLILLVTILVLVGCSKQDDTDDLEINKETEAEIVEESEEKTEEETEEEIQVVEIPAGYVISRLSGEYIPEDLAGRRPYILMINNIKDANPQSGTSQATIIYEALVEGGITRLMGVFEDFSADRIGSIRSGRQYFASIADEYDSIFVSFGESSNCTSKIQELGLDQLSGLRGEGGTVFYRDSSIKAPHNAFASKEGVIKGTEMKEFNTDYNDGLNNHFIFYKEDTDLTSDQDVNKLTLKFSNYASPYFVYDSENKLYNRFQYGSEHIDANTGEQLKFKNIIVQFVDGFDIDETYSFSFKEASGDGYFITNGKASPITWDKNEQNRSMVYYNSDKSMLEINPGKTFIAIFPGDKTSDIVFE